MKKILQSLFAAALLSTAVTGHAALYTNNYGINAGTPSNCDDCSSAAFQFGGAGHSLTLFGTTYTDMYVNSNGYVTFGGPGNGYSLETINRQVGAPFIAAFHSDLDSRDDFLSNVFVNIGPDGELIATWVQMGHWDKDYSKRSTFQMVIRSDQAAIPAGEGQIGFFYGDITDPSIASAGFSDGKFTVGANEIVVASRVAGGQTLSNAAPFWFDLSPQGQPARIPEPAGLALLGIGLSGLLLARRRKA